MYISVKKSFVNGIIFLAPICTGFYSCIVYAEGINVQVTTPLQRVFKDTVYNDFSKNIILSAARNEFESTQIALHTEKKVTLDNVIISDLKIAGSNNTLLNKNCTVRTPEYVYVDWNTRATPQNELDRKAPGWFPDPLPDFTPFSFSGSRSILITCHIPSDQVPGIYKGEVKVVINGSDIALPMELKVWDFLLPEDPSIDTSMWLHTSQLVKQYGIPRNTDKYWDLIELVAKDMKNHRQNIIYTRLNIIKTEQLNNGKYIFDFSDYERWVKLFLKYNFSAIEAGPFFHPKAFNIISESNGKKVKFNKTSLMSFLQSKHGQDFLRIYLRALHEKNIQLGIEKKFLQHVGDEAKPEQRKLYRQLVKIVHEEMPGVPVIDATHLSSSQRIGMMDVPVTNMRAAENEQASSLGQPWGKWWYTAGFNPRGKMPNRFIDYPLVKMRMISWLGWRYKMSGYLHYAYNWWQLPSKQSPWELTQYKNYSAGDAWIVYPPKDKSLRAPVSSMRWEVFRDGLEDYEYFVLLEKWLLKLDAMADMNDSGAIVDDIATGKAIVALLESEVKSKTEYPRDAKQVDMIRLKVGGWLSHIAKNYDSTSLQ